MSEQRGSVTTQGSAQVSAPSDIAIARLGARATAPDVQSAIERANQGQAALRDALVGAGVALADVRSVNTSSWTQDNDGRTQTTVTLTLMAVIRDVAAAGEVIREALSAAGDVANLDGLEFGIADRSELLAEARAAAFADARAKAVQFTELAGRELGEVLTIVEGAPGGAAPMPRALMARAAAADALTVEAGTQEVSADVTVTWELN